MCTWLVALRSATAQSSCDGTIAGLHQCPATRRCIIDNQRGLLPAINQTMKCRIFHLQQRPKTHLARRKCTLCCLDGRTLSAAGLHNKITLTSGRHFSTVYTVGVLHHTINTSATAYKKPSVDMVMDCANLVLLVMDGLPVRNRCKQSKSRNQFKRMVTTNKMCSATRIVCD